VTSSSATEQAPSLGEKTLQRAQPQTQSTSQATTKMQRPPATRAEALQRLRDTLASGGAIIGAGAGSF